MNNTAQVVEAPFPLRYDLSVVAPCFNEEKNVVELAERLTVAFKKNNINGQIVLVNDASKDGTGVAIDALAARLPNLVAVHHANNRGIEGGWQSGIAASSGEFVCLMDADLQNLPEDVPRLLREIRHTNADLVQGVRSSIGRVRDSRYLLSKGLNTILNVMFGMRARDNKSGFVLGRKELFEDILRHRFQYRYFQSFITVAAHARRYRIHEVETLFESRMLGKSFMPKIPVSVVFFCLVDIAKAFFEYRLTVSSPDILAEFLNSHPPLRRDAPMSPVRRFWFEAFFLTMPLHKWMISRKTKASYQLLKRSQWLAPAEIRELQNLKLRKLVQHAYTHVPYYKELFRKNGISPADIQTIDDLVKIPLLTKDDVRQNLYFDLFSDNHEKKKTLRVTTSGSTGQPFVCFVDRSQLEMRWAATQRAAEWAGCDFASRQIRLWHQTIGMSPLQVIREKIDAWFQRRTFVPAFEMSEEKISQLAALIERVKPTYIDGYAESFNLLACHLKDRPLKGITLRGIMSSAQSLPKQSREQIERVFGCKVFDKYGSREFSGIAYECEAHSGHHIVAENFIVEVLKDGRPALPGEVGEVVITDLNNYCQPFIRYRIGDLAEQVDNSLPCACGRGLPRLGEIAGRVQSIIIGANGRYLPGAFFAHYLKDYDYIIRQFQVIQEQPGKIVLRIIKATRFDEAQFQDVLSGIRGFLGAETEINIEFVNHIPLVRTGKHQGSISRVGFDFQKLGVQLASDSECPIGQDHA